MVKGNYYVGDLCYAVNDKDWQEIFSFLFPNFPDDGGETEGVFTLSDGRVGAIFDAHGDGSIDGYSLDSGHLGCIKLEDCTSDADRTRLERVGRIVNFEKDFDAYRNGDALYFGNIRIWTGDYVTYEEDELGGVY